MDCPAGYVRVVMWDQGETVLPAMTHVECAEQVGPEHTRAGEGILAVRVADLPESLCVWCGGRIPDPPQAR